MKGCTWSQKYSKNLWLRLTGNNRPKVCQENKKYSDFPHPDTTSTSLDGWHKRGWVHGFILVVLNSDPTVCVPNSSVQATLFQSLAVLFWWACPHCSLSTFILAKSSGTRYRLLLLKPICLKFWYAVHSEMLFSSPQLYRAVIRVIAAPLWAWTSSAIFCWLLSSTWCFRPQNCSPLHVFFSLLHHTKQSPETVAHEKPQIWGSEMNWSDACG